MKRVHVHVSVPDFEPSNRLYSTLFGAEPVARVVKVPVKAAACGSRPL